MSEMSAEGDRNHTVRGDALLHASPRLDVSGMGTPVADNPLGSDVLDELVHAGVLTDGTDGDAAAITEVRVLDEHVGGVGFGGHGVVAFGHVPVPQGDVVGVEGVDAVCVLCRCLRYTCRSVRDGAGYLSG